MKTNYLLPNRFKLIGWIILIPSLVLCILFFIFEFEPDFLNIKLYAFAKESTNFLTGSTIKEYFTFVKTNALDEILALSLIISALFVAFSKEKDEDEFISKIRLESLVWATYVNYAILFFSIIFIFGISFLWVMVINMFTILLFFIIRFNWLIHKSKKIGKNEE